MANQQLIDASSTDSKKSNDVDDGAPLQITIHPQQTFSKRRPARNRSATGLSNDGTMIKKAVRTRPMVAPYSSSEEDSGSETEKQKQHAQKGLQQQHLRMTSKLGNLLKIFGRRPQAHHESDATFRSTPSLITCSRAPPAYSNHNSVTEPANELDVLTGPANSLSDTIHQAARTGDVFGLKLLLDKLKPRIAISYINSLDETGLSPLHYAARYHHVEIVRLLLSRGANVNIVEEEGQTPLHFACRHKLRSVTSSALPPTYHLSQAMRVQKEEYANMMPPRAHLPTFSTENIDNVDHSGSNTAVILSRNESRSSSQHGTPTRSLRYVDSIGNFYNHYHDSVVRILGKAGANVNARDRFGNAPLHVAVMRDNEVVVRELLNFPNIQVGIMDHSNQTVLHIAALSGHSLEIVRLLCEFNVIELRSVDVNLNTPLHLACAQGNVEVAQFLLNKAAELHGEMYVREMLSDREDERQIPLILAVEGGHKEVVRLLLTRGSPVDDPNLTLDTALHISAARGDVDTCRLLVEQRGATVDFRNIRLQTPLHRACAQNQLDAASYLLKEAGASLEAQDQHLMTPLLVAARNGHAAVVQLLLNQGANIFAASKQDRNVLFWAAARNNVEVVSVLFEHYAKGAGELLRRGDRYGYYPIHIACQRGHLEVVRIMIQNGARIDERLEDEKTPLHLAAQRGWHQVVALLTAQRADLVPYEDENSDTALHVAALNGHADTVMQLIKLGANVAARNANLRTPLDAAASRGHTSVCEVLLKTDADVDTQDKTSTTPLHLACCGGYVDTVRMLIEHGASLSFRAIDGRNCLDFAVDAGQAEVAMFIIKSPRWRDALRNEQYVRQQRDGRVFRDTPLRKLIRTMPHVAFEALNRCIETKRRIDDPQHKVKFYYEFLDDTFSLWQNDPPFTEVSSTPPSNFALHSSPKLARGAMPYATDASVIKDNHSLMVMVRNGREQLLMHPLTTSLIHTKWQSCGRYVFLINFLAYCMYLCLLTGYTMSSSPVNRLYYVQTFEQNQTYTAFWARDACTSHTQWPLSADINALEDAEVCQVIERYRAAPFNCSMSFLEKQANDTTFYIFFTIGQYALLISSVALFFKDVAQFVVMRSADSVLAWFVYLMTIVMTLPWDGFTCYQSYGLKASWRWQLASFNIFLAWIKFVLHLRYLPWIGLYVQMLEDVTLTVTRVFFVFFGVVLAFALSFYTAFKASVRHDQQPDFLKEGIDDGWELNQFYSIPQALIKSFTMLVGEYEQESHFTNTNLPVILVIYILFVIVGSIIVANLLIGLAVADIRAVQENASLKRVAMRINFVLSIEQLMPLRLRRQLFRNKFVAYPNAPHHIAHTDGRKTAKSGWCRNIFGWSALAVEHLLGETAMTALDIHKAMSRSPVYSGVANDKTDNAAAIAALVDGNVGLLNENQKQLHPTVSPTPSEGGVAKYDSSAVLASPGGGRDIGNNNSNGVHADVVRQLLENAVTTITSGNNEGVEKDETDQQVVAGQRRTPTQQVQRLDAVIMLQAEMLKVLGSMRDDMAAAMR